MAFAVGDKCVVPNLGVGIVKAIEELEFDGKKYQMYQIKILDNGMTFNCDVNKAEANSLRPIIRTKRSIASMTS
jgi:RNA polymerase-interacting CarD/CdnL/TRCF family regulator